MGCFGVWLVVLAGGAGALVGAGRGLSGSALAVASQACCGVIRPGRPWWGRWVLQIWSKTSTWACSSVKERARGWACG